MQPTVWPVAIDAQQVEELEHGHWRQDFEEMMADPLDGYSLFALFLEPEPVEEFDEWDPEPNDWQWMDDSDPLDETSLAYLFWEQEEEDQGPDLMNPRMFSGLSTSAIINITRDSASLTRSLDIFDCPQTLIIRELFPRPDFQTPDDPHICVLDLEDLWGKEELVNVWVDGEELTVNKAMLDEGSLQVNV